MDLKLLDGLMQSMVKPEDIRFRFKGMFYGEPGARKTVTASAIGSKVLFIVADPAGWTSLKNHPELGLGTRIQLMEYKGVSQLEALGEAFDEDNKLVREFDTVLIDTLSHIASMDLSVVQKTAIVKAEKNPKKGEFDFERDMFPVYNQNAMRIRNALQKLLSAPINVVATAHSKEYEIKQFGQPTGNFVIRPKFNPEIFSEVNANFSMIAYMSARVQVDRQGNVDYKCETQFHPTQTIVAKTRIGGLPVKANSPNIKEIVENWIASGAELTSHEEAETIHPSDQGIQREELELSSFDL